VKWLQCAFSQLFNLPLKRSGEDFYFKGKEKGMILKSLEVK